MKKAEPHNMGFYLFIPRDFGHPCPIFLSGKLGKGVQKSLYPDFCIALLGDRPEILSGRPLSNYNKAMSHEKGRTAQHGFLPLHSGDFGHPCPIFLSGKIGQSVQIPCPDPDFCIALLGDRTTDSLGTSPYFPTTRLCLMRRQNRTTWVSTSSFRGLWTPLPYFPLRENWAKVSPKSPLYPDFCIALLGDRPEILSGRPP